MNNYDDLFSKENSNDSFKEKNKNTPFNKDAWIEKKKQETLRGKSLRQDRKGIFCIRRSISESTR